MDGIRIPKSFMRALRRGRATQKHDWEDDFIAPPSVDHTVKQELGKIGRPHHRFDLDPGKYVERLLYLRE